MRLIVIISVLFAMVSGAFAQDPQNMKVDTGTIDCEELPTSFQSFADALKSIEGASYRFTQNFKTTRRSGVMAASYYSCKNEHGFLVITIDGLRKIYREFPRIGWKRLIETNDLDGYYQQEIKDKVPLVAREIN